MHGTNTGGRRRIHVAALGIAFATLTACGGEAREPRVHVATADSGATRERNDERDVRATSAHDVAVAQAEGAHSVAVERCNALAGDARNACRDRADADLELAKSRAKQALDART